MNQFGWIWEVDPRRPNVLPKKHTALGRFKHESIEMVTGRNGEAVCYMGDDQRFDYVYKFVSAEAWQTAIANGRDPLADGTLYVAKFNDDGTGEWLPLVYDVNGPLNENTVDPETEEPVPFNDQGEVCIKARIAADILGATPMDRPEWISADPNSTYVYGNMTNNSRREADDTDAANPRGPNFFGHILRWKDSAWYTGTTFEWEVFLLGGETSVGTLSDGKPGPDGSAVGSPDGLGHDADGRLWIQTDGGQPDGANNQMFAVDPATGDLKRFFTGPNDCEVTGLTWTKDFTTMFINVQHPGDSATIENKRITSSFPDYDDSTPPRPATIVIQKTDGGVIGTAPTDLA